MNHKFGKNNEQAQLTPIVHKKLYKAKKNWLIAGMALGATLGTATVAHADTTNNQATGNTGSANAVTPQAQSDDNGMHSVTATISGYEKSTIGSNGVPQSASNSTTSQSLVTDRIGTDETSDNTSGNPSNAVTNQFGDNATASNSTVVSSYANSVIVSSGNGSMTLRYNSAQFDTQTSRFNSLSSQGLFISTNTTANAGISNYSAPLTAPSAFDSLSTVLNSESANINSQISTLASTSANSIYQQMSSEYASFQTQYASNSADTVNFSHMTSLMSAYSNAISQLASGYIVTSNMATSASAIDINTAFSSAYAPIISQTVSYYQSNGLMSDILQMSVASSAVANYNSLVNSFNGTIMEINGYNTFYNSLVATTSTSSYASNMATESALYSQMHQYMINYAPISANPTAAQSNFGYQQNDWDKQVGLANFDGNHIVQSFRWDPTDKTSAMVDIDQNGTMLVHDGRFNLNSPVDVSLSKLLNIAPNTTWINSLGYGLSVNTLLFHNATRYVYPIANDGDNADTSTNQFRSFLFEIKNVDLSGSTGYDDVTALGSQGGHNVNFNFGNTFDAHHLQSLSSLFGDNPFMQNINFGAMDTSTVTDFSYMLNDQFSLQTLILGPQFTTKNAKDMTGIFELENNSNGVYSGSTDSSGNWVSVTLPLHVFDFSGLSFDNNPDTQGSRLINGATSKLILGPAFKKLPSNIQVTANNYSPYSAPIRIYTTPAFLLDLGPQGTVNYMDLSLNQAYSQDPSTYNVPIWTLIEDYRTHQLIPFTDDNGFYNAKLVGLVGNANISDNLNYLKTQQTTIANNISHNQQNITDLATAKTDGSQQVADFSTKFGSNTADKNYAPAKQQLDQLLAQLNQLENGTHQAIDTKSADQAIDDVSKTDFSKLDLTNFTTTKYDSNNQPIDKNAAYQTYQTAVDNYNQSVNTVGDVANTASQQVTQSQQTLAAATKLQNQIKTLIANYQPYQAPVPTTPTVTPTTPDKPSQPSTTPTVTPTTPSKPTQPTTTPTVTPTQSNTPTTSPTTPAKPSQPTTTPVVPTIPTVNPTTPIVQPTHQQGQPSVPTVPSVFSNAVTPVSPANPQLVDGYVTIPAAQPTNQSDTSHQVAISLPQYFNIQAPIEVQTAHGSELIQPTNRPRFKVLNLTEQADGTLVYQINDHGVLKTIHDTTGNLISTYDGATEMLKSGQTELPVHKWVKFKQPVYEHTSFSFKNDRVKKLTKSVWVVKIVRQGLITRYQLNNGHYVTSNQYFVSK